MPKGLYLKLDSDTKTKIAHWRREHGRLVKVSQSPTSSGSSQSEGEPHTVARIAVCNPSDKRPPHQHKTRVVRIPLTQNITAMVDSGCEESTLSQDAFLTFLEDPTIKMTVQKIAPRAVTITGWSQGGPKISVTHKVIIHTLQVPCTVLSSDGNGEKVLVDLVDVPFLVASREARPVDQVFLSNEALARGMQHIVINPRGNCLSVLADQAQKVEFAESVNCEHEVYLTPPERARLMELKNKHAASFCSRLPKGGASKLPPLKLRLKITTEDLDKKIVDMMGKKACPIPDKHLAEVRKQTLELLEQGIVERHDDDTFDNSLVMEQQGDKVRVCLNSKPVNELLMDEPQTVPNLDQNVRLMQGFKYYASFDVLKAYHQLHLNKEDRRLTSFYVPGVGRLRYCGCPFGLKPLPGQWNHHFGRLFHGISEPYFDDCPIGANTIEELFDKVDKFLTICHDNNIFLKSSKAIWVTEHLQFAGHILSQTQVAPRSVLCDAFQKMEPPTSFNELDTFLGAVNWWGHKSIPHLASMTAHLRSLQAKGFPNKKSRVRASLRAKIDFKQLWDDNAETLAKEFRDVVAAMQTSKLFVPNRSWPWILQHDASTTGLGAILYQQNPHSDECEPLAVTSHRFTGPEVRWSIPEKECYGLVYAARKWKHLLLGKSFRAKTDAKNLLFMSESTKPKIKTWFQELLQYDIAIEHIPGISNTIPDQLSRMGTPFQDPEPCTHKEIVLLSAMKHSSPSYDQGHFDLVVKAHEQAHHLGRDRLYERLRPQKWPQLYQMVKDAVNSCSVCNRHRHDPVEYQLQNEILPCESTITTDWIGPLTETQRGNKWLQIIVNTATRIKMLHPAPSKTAANAILGLKKYCFTYGLPDKLVADGEFKVAVIQDFCNMHGIHLHTTTPNCPTSHGMVERHVQDVKNMLKKSLFPHGAGKDKDEEWDILCYEVAFNLNQAHCRTMGTSPHSTLFKKQPKDRLHLLLDAQQQEYDPNALEDAKQHTQKLCKEANKKKTHPPQLRPGSLVLWNKPRNRKANLGSKYCGPYKVLSTRNKVIVMIQAITHDFKTEVHIRELKQYKRGNKSNIQVQQEAEHDQQEYTPSAIVDSKMLSDGSKQYKVSWEGYDASEDTWEPEENLRHLTMFKKYICKHSINPKGQCCRR